jgi:hypothetical protein
MIDEHWLTIPEACIMPDPIAALAYVLEMVFNSTYLTDYSHSYSLLEGGA